jgi:hypothetical protein
MLATESALKDRDRVLEQLRRIVVTAHGVKDSGQRRAVGGDGRMLVAQRSCADGHGQAGRRLAIPRPPASVREPTDVVQDHADIGVRWAERGDEGGPCLLIQQGRLVESAGVLEHNTELVPDPSRGEVIGRQAALGDSQRPTVGLLGSSQVADSAAKPAEPA